jgi:hypothetical protein
MSKRLVAVLLFATAILAPGLYAKKKSHGDQGSDEDYKWRQAARFQSGHKQVIHEYYRAYPEGLPPGLAKRGGDLPPGLAKKLQRNGQLPPGLEKRLVPFPAELDRRLPPLAPYHRRCFVGDRAIVYDQRTGGIIDSLKVVINIGR